MKKNVLQVLFECALTSYRGSVRILEVKFSAAGFLTESLMDSLKLQAKEPLRLLEGAFFL